MFSRLKNAVEVLRSPIEQSPISGVSAFPTEKETKELWSGKPRPWNPAVSILERVLVCYFVAYAGFPLFARLFKQDSTASMSASLVSLTVVFLVNSLAVRLHGALGRIIRLDFLDPFIGKHLKKAIQILGDQDDKLGS